jgi:hypothetical protein
VAIRRKQCGPADGNFSTAEINEERKTLPLDLGPMADRLGALLLQTWSEYVARKILRSPVLTAMMTFLDRVPKE